MAQTKRSGQGIRRLITLCGLITHLITENDHRLTSNSDGENDDDEDDGSDNNDDDNDNDDDEDGDGKQAEKKKEIKRQASR